MNKAQAIILKTIPYSEQQKIICAYTREQGFLSFISPAYILKRRNDPLHPMLPVEIEYVENERGNLNKLRSADPLVSVPDLYFDVCKMNIALLWGEVLNLMLSKEGKNEYLFDYIRESVEYLSTTKEDAANFNLFFLYRLATPLGLRINHETWQEGYVFSINDAAFCVPSPTTHYVSGPNTARVIHKFCVCQIEELKSIPLNQQSRRILLDIILLFFSTHLNIDFNTKSILVIREIFG